MTIRFWFEFFPNKTIGLPPGIRIGCGVTAYSLDHAKRILEDQVFNGPLPNVSRITENIDINDLDPGHVLPNMGPPNRIGIWFPLGYPPT